MLLKLKYNILVINVSMLLDCNILLKDTVLLYYTLLNQFELNFVYLLIKFIWIEMDWKLLYILMRLKTINYVKEVL